MGPKSNDSVLPRREDRDTQGGMSCEDKGLGVRQPQARDHQKLEDASKDPPVQSSEGA